MVLSLGSVRQLMQSCCLGQRLQQQFGAVCQRAAQQAQQQQLGSRSSRHFAAQPARALEQSLCCVDRSLTAFRFAPLAMAMNKRVGFMGAGQMAEALARGLIDKGVIEPANICCSDPTPSRKELFRSLGATPFDTNLEVGGGAARPPAQLQPLLPRRAGVRQHARTC
jgi:pyrroline-5-carboxylate reductase